MESRCCVICFSPAVVIPYSLSLVKWQKMWRDFYCSLPSVIITNDCLNKILLNDGVNFCKRCFDSSMELSFIREEINNLINEKSRVINATLNGILQRRNASFNLLNPHVNVETKKIERCDDSKDTVVVHQSNVNSETVNIEEVHNTETTDSPVDVESVDVFETISVVGITNHENATVETRPVLLKENATDRRNTAVVKQSSLPVMRLTPSILINRVRGEIDESTKTTHLEKSKINVPETVKPTSLTRDRKVKERQKAHNNTTGKLPKASYKKSTVRKNAAKLPKKKQQKEKVHHIFKCQLCFVILKSQRNLEIHITKAHNGKKLSSSHIERRTSTISSPSSSKKSYQCSLCKTKTFSTKLGLQRHERTHKTEGDFKCSICEKNFSSKSNLKAHEQNHSENRRNPYKCFLCAKRFYTIERRTAHHEEIHNVREQTYECSVCPKTFDLKRNLMKHELSHTEEPKRSLKCSVCDKAYINKGSLAKHEKLHSKKIK